MESSNDTVLARKTVFLRTQVRILSQPLRPPPRRRGDEDSDHIPDSAIREVTRTVNRSLQRHSKESYPFLSIRHIAHQLDVLYSDTAKQLKDDDENESDDEDASDYILRVGDDLRLDEIISKLPDPPPEELENLVVRLQDLSDRRGAAQRRLREYHALLSQLEPYKQPLNSIQPNLVTRDAELPVELTKLRGAVGVRAARVETYVKDHSSGRARGQDKIAVGDLRGNEKQKMEQLLDTL